MGTESKLGDNLTKELKRIKKDLKVIRKASDEILDTIENTLETLFK